MFGLTNVALNKGADTPLSDNEIDAYNYVIRELNFTEAVCLTEADCEEQMSEGYMKF